MPLLNDACPSQTQRPSLGATPTTTTTRESLGELRPLGPPPPERGFRPPDFFATKCRQRLYVGVARCQDCKRPQALWWHQVGIALCQDCKRPHGPWGFCNPDMKQSCHSGVAENGSPSHPCGHWVRGSAQNYSTEVIKGIGEGAPSISPWFDPFQKSVHVPILGNKKIETAPTKKICSPHGRPMGVP